MKYWVLAADYLEYSLRDVGGGQVAPEFLTAAIRDELASWNTEYQAVIPLDMAARQVPANARLIEALDHRGRELAELLRTSRPDVKEVRYYSEGNLRFLS